MITPTGRTSTEVGDAPDMVEHARVLELIQAVSLDRGAPAPAGDWLAGHRAEVLATVLACDQAGLRAAGVQLAVAAWPAAALVPDPRWWVDLAEAGESLALADRDPAALVDLLHRAATTFARHGERLRAEERWVRALAVSRRDGLHDHRQTLLSALGDLYRAWGRLGKALDAYLGLVDLRRDAGEPAGTADALVEVGTTMHAAGRVRAAEEYFDRADELMAPITEVENAAPESLTAHARILVWGGRTRWEQGRHGAARRLWSRALAMLVDVDDDAAHQVRALLAADPAEPPPYLDELSRSSASGGAG
jgi:tetratricopeptide (TPR) repeat protein